MTPLADVLLGQGQRFARGHAQLPFHQVQPGNELGDRVLHLQAGVDLHEIELPVGIDDELHGAGVDVIDGLRGLHRRIAHRRAQRGCQERRGGFLQHLLVAALGRAFALVEVQRVAVRIGEHLDLDVARRRHVALQQHAVAAEGVGGLALAAFQLGDEVLQPVHHAHALAAATVGGLDHQREADARGFAGQRVRRLVLAGIAGDDGHARGRHQFLRTGLAAHLAHRRARGPDEHQAGRGDGIGEVGVLRQEAVAGMDGLRTGFPGRRDDGVAAQVAVRRARPADQVGLVGLAYVLGIGVRLGVHRDGADAESTAGTDDTAGDLAAVGDQDFREHGF